MSALENLKAKRVEDTLVLVFMFGVLAALVGIVCAAVFWNAVWLWLAAGGASAALVALFCPIPSESVKAEEQPELPPGRLSVDSDYFMPFCVCPKCDVEALHWMSEPDTAEATATIARFQRRVDEYIKDEDEHWARTARTGRIETYWRREKPKETSAVKMARQVLAGRIHVIRTCREPECKHEWPQRIWSPDADAE